MAAPVLQFKRGLLANLPGLRAGEPGFTTDSYDLYVGLTSETSTNKFFGSHRYWTKETTSTGSGVNLVEGTSNGSAYITLKSPDSLAGVGTYTLPDTNTIVDGYFLKVGSDGSLSWDTAGGTNGTFTNPTLVGITTITGSLDNNANTDFSGITTFSNTTNNTLGNANTGAVQIDGGLGVNGNVTLGTDLNVQGNSTFVGLSTFTGAIDANGGANISGGETILSSATVSDLTSGRVVLAGTSGALEDSGNLTFNGSTLNVIGLADLDDVNVSSAATIAVADIGSATIDSLVFTSGIGITSVDTDLSSVSASDDTLASAKAIKAYVDSQVTAQDLDFAGDTGTGAVDLDSQTFTIAGTASEIVTSASGQTITIGLPDNVVIGAGLTVTGALDVNGGGTIDNIQIGVTGDNEIDTSTGNLTIDSAGGTTTIDDELIVSGDVRINGNDIKASDGNTNITLTSNTLTTFAGDIKVTGNDIQSSTATALTLSGANVTVAGDLTVGGSDIKAADGTTALTLTNSTGAVTAASDLTVSGNLYVNGSTTQVNTTALTVEDRTIDLGMVNGVAPASATTWDLGILFNYNSSGAKKSAVVWEHSETRFKFASVLAADTNGTDVNTPQLTVTTFAPIEIGALWVTDCAGTSQVISCTGTERFLENITVDAGTF